MVELLPFAVFVASFAALAKASDITVDNVVKFSHLTKISEMTLGFIFLSVATSLPELGIVLTSGFQGQELLGIAMLFGSNIADILILGVMGLVATFYIPKEDKASLTQIIAITSMIALFSLALGGINITFAVFALAMFYLVSKPVIKNNIVDNHNDGIPTIEVIKSSIVIAAGIAVILISSQLVTQSSIDISGMLGIHETLIGITIIAAGTSLPEFIVSLSAIRKNDVSLAVGNILGSLLTNLTLILGIGGLFATIIFDAPTKLTIAFLLGVNVVFYVLANARFDRRYGSMFLVIYGIFLLSLYVVS